MRGGASGLPAPAARTRRHSLPTRPPARPPARPPPPPARPPAPARRVQVLANSAGGVAAALAAQAAPAALAPRAADAARFAATAGLVAFFAAVTADTWASEVGVLAATPPRLVTTWARVPPGTNGGVSALGCGCSAAAGLFIGGAFWALAAALPEPVLLPLPPAALLRPSSGGGGGGGWLARALAASASGGGGARSPRALALWLAVGLAAGVAGSLVDSLLGATLQYSGVDAKSGRVVNAPRPGVRRVAGRALLSNDGVNAAAACLTAGGAAAAAWVALR